VSIRAASSATSQHPFVASLAGVDLEVVPIELAPRGYRAERAAVKDLCACLRPDVVHTHGYRADVLDAAVARRQGLATVTTVHGFTGGDWKNRLYEWLQRRAFRWFDAVVAVSRPLATALAARLGPERVHWIPNAWDGSVSPLDRAAARRALGVPSDGFRIGWVGRMSPEKGPDVALEALALLDDAVSLSMVGDAGEALRARASALGVGARVTWHGARHNAAALLPAFDAFALSSRTEGTPMVLFEAMAANVPVVATRVGGVPDVLTSAEALLVPPEDPGAFAAAVRNIFDDRAAARLRAVAAHERLERHFAAPQWLARYDAVYGAVLARRATAGEPGA